MKHLLPLTFALLSLLLAASCAKTPINGKLDGQWIMQAKYSKSHPSEPAYTHYEDKRYPGLFWNVSLRLITITGGGAWNGISGLTSCRFVHEGDKLAITEVYLNDRAGFRDILVTDPETRALEPLGLRGNATNFRISRFTSTELILCSELDSLVFRKRH